MRTQVLDIIRRWFTTMGLELNERKTSVKQARTEAFDFLGYTFTMLHSYKTGVPYPGATPSKKAVQRLETQPAAGGWCGRISRPLPEVVETLNHKLRGWATYFRYGSVWRVRAESGSRLCISGVRGFLRRRHQVQTRANRRFPQRYVFGKLGVISLKALGGSV